MMGDSTSAWRRPTLTKPLCLAPLARSLRSSWSHWPRGAHEQLRVGGPARDQCCQHFPPVRRPLEQPGREGGSSQFEFISLVLPPRREVSWDAESSGSSRSCHSPTLLRQLLTITEVASPQGRRAPADHLTRSSSSDKARCGRGLALALGRHPMTTAISFGLREYLLLAAD